MYSQYNKTHRRIQRKGLSPSLLPLFKEALNAKYQTSLKMLHIVPLTQKAPADPCNPECRRKQV